MMNFLPKRSVWTLEDLRLEIYVARLISFIFIPNRVNSQHILTKKRFQNAS